MKTLVAQIVEQGRKPREFRGELRAGSETLGSMLVEIRRLRRVRASVPHDVLGGDLLGMFSDRMRRLLEERNEPPAVEQSSRAIDDDGTDPKANVAGTSSLDPSMFLNPSSPQLEEGLVGSGTWVAPDMSQPRRRDGRRDAPRESLLEKKVREYWELVTQQRNNQVPNDATRSPANGAPRTGGASFLLGRHTKWSWDEFATSSLSRSGRWPGQPAQSRTIQPAANGSEPHAHSGENPPTISKRGRTTGEVDAGAEDLSKRLSEILLEQAMQHGIDVT